MVKSPLANAGDVRDTVLIPGLGRSPEGGKGNSLAWRISGQRSLAGYGLQGCKELVMTEVT